MNRLIILTARRLLWFIEDSFRVCFQKSSVKPLTDIYPNTHVHTPQAQTHTHAHTHARTHAHTHTHIYTHTHTHTRTHKHTHTHIYTHARTHTHARTRSRTHARTHARTHTHTHTHIHTGVEGGKGWSGGYKKYYKHHKLPNVQSFRLFFSCMSVIPREVTHRRRSRLVPKGSTTNINTTIFSASQWEFCVLCSCSCCLGTLDTRREHLNHSAVFLALTRNCCA